MIMKVPRLRGGEEPTAIVGFEVEQMIMSTLAGPHVPKLVAKGDFTGLPYIVMERIEGWSLRARLDDAPLPIDDVARIGAKVATALHDLHRQRVIHLDVKPSNIMFRSRADGSEGDAVLIDFGLARHDLLPDLLEEEFDRPMGTSPYMSPEQVRFIRNDPRSDLFSTGVMLYHLTTGERPFGMPTTRARRAPAPLPRADRAAEPARRLPAVAAGDHPPLPRGAAGPSLPDRGPARVRSAAPRPGGARRARDAQRRRQLGRGGAALVRIARLGARGAARCGRAVGAQPDRPRRRRSPRRRAGLLEAERDVAERLLNTEPDARLACLTVMKINRIGMDELLEPDGTSKHVQLLARPPPLGAAAAAVARRQEGVRARSRHVPRP